MVEYEIHQLLKTTQNKSTIIPRLECRSSHCNAQAHLMILPNSKNINWHKILGSNCDERVFLKKKKFFIFLFLGVWWGSKTKQPVLALHGWQDNAGTWDKLSPYLLPEISILAIDLPGHGLSSHYPPGQMYYLFWDGVYVVSVHINFSLIIIVFLQCCQI